MKKNDINNNFESILKKEFDSQQSLTQYFGSGMAWELLGLYYFKELGFKKVELNSSPNKYDLFYKGKRGIKYVSIKMGESHIIANRVKLEGYYQCEDLNKYIEKHLNKEAPKRTTSMAECNIITVKNVKPEQQEIKDPYLIYNSLSITNPDYIYNIDNKDKSTDIPYVNEFLQFRDITEKDFKNCKELLKKDNISVREYFSYLLNLKDIIYFVGSIDKYITKIKKEGYVFVFSPKYQNFHISTSNDTFGKVITESSASLFLYDKDRKSYINKDRKTFDKSYDCNHIEIKDIYPDIVLTKINSYKKYIGYEELMINFEKILDETNDIGIDERNKKLEEMIFKYMNT